MGDSTAARPAWARARRGRRGATASEGLGICFRTLCCARRRSGPGRPSFNWHGSRMGNSLRRTTNPPAAALNFGTQIPSPRPGDREDTRRLRHEPDVSIVVHPGASRIQPDGPPRARACRTARRRARLLRSRKARIARHPAREPRRGSGHEGATCRIGAEKLTPAWLGSRPGARHIAIVTERHRQEDHRGQATRAAVGGSGVVAPPADSTSRTFRKLAGRSTDDRGHLKNEHAAECGRRR